MPIDFEERLLAKLDQIDDRIRDLCERQTRTETQLGGHFKEIEDKQSAKERKFYYVIALMGIAFTIQEIVRSMI